MRAPAAPAIVLHIGAMKTGTTYLQNLLQANRSAFREQGWWVPRQGRVVKAVREVLGLTDAGATGRDHTPTWDDVSRRLREWEGAGAIVSMEFLSYAGRPAAERVLRDLAGTDVHVVLTVRDAAAALPSQWQSYSRNKGAVSWPEFARDVRTTGADSAARRTFRRTQAIPRMLSVWTELRPADRLTVITLPGAGQPRDLLWRRFMSVGGIDPAATHLDETAFDNPRLGYGSCELLRRLNGAGLREVRPSAYRKVVRYVARNHLLHLRELESSPRLDRTTAKFAARLNRKTRASITEHTTLVGDLDELPVRLPASSTLDPGRLPADAPEHEVTRALEVAREGILRRFADVDQRPPQDLAAPSDDAETATARLAGLMRVAAETW